MRDGPDIARVAALIGDPARANMLSALMSGKALTATELAQEAGVQAQTASSHLSRLVEGGLVAPRKSGRHKYFSLAGEEVAEVLEALMGLAAGKGHLRTRTGPKDQAMRQARVCYNHLAGEMGVQMFRSLQARGVLVGPDLQVSPRGRQFLNALGLDLAALPKSRAPMCKECLDWSARQSHLAGRLGRALLSHFIDEGWARRQADSRVVQFTPQGQRQFEKHFGKAVRPQEDFA
ncbi:winged helix-turn-helix domain-containing protein [Thalassovita sp.]|uniref:ArsR/SmtB family transcription factor n=1 Tax=Thalassovita sp. TaxID=1979401 RepID=UPI002AB0E250|nr:winged helix-turn-helix domain-containing protein [Thalassovita sp.]